MARLNDICLLCALLLPLSPSSVFPLTRIKRLLWFVLDFISTADVNLINSLKAFVSIRHFRKFHSYCKMFKIHEWTEGNGTPSLLTFEILKNPEKCHFKTFSVVIFFLFAKRLCDKEKTFGRSFVSNEPVKGQRFGNRSGTQTNPAINSNALSPIRWYIRLCMHRPDVNIDPHEDEPNSGRSFIKYVISLTNTFTS